MGKGTGTVSSVPGRERRVRDWPTLTVASGDMMGGGSLCSGLS